MKKLGKALVVGAGIGGIRAALDLADNGYGVTLIDRAPHIGGILSQLDYQFPSNHCGMCKLLPLVQRDSSSQFCLRKGLFHENIDILPGTEITAVEGEPGNFTVAVREKSTWVDPDRCTGCGLCVEVCPAEAPDGFNAGLGTRKAIYLPVPHNIPNTYVIDPAACSRCGECEKICPTRAIELAADRRGDFRILVVDDEFVIRDSLKEWLESERFTVDTAESGPDALEKIAAEPFHLMLTDIKMPGMDGVELLKKAQESVPDLQVLMMTAYATVETAVEAMKVGALDYLMKPFDPEVMVSKIVEVFTALESGKDRKLAVGAVVLCGGTDFFHPADEKNVYGYGVNPNVMTSLEFERVLSGTGPSAGRLIRVHDGKAVKKIAWLQCVGSRDIQCGADFCSSICCMYAVKEALLAKERAGDDLEAAIFYMDMRTFGQSFQRYRDRAEKDRRVRFERTRVHSITSEAASGDPVVRYARPDGSATEERFDLVILAVGQRPAAGTARLAEWTGAGLNPWGYIQTDPFLPVGTAAKGIVAGGSFTGLKDISESVISASAASVEASRTIHAAGGGLIPEPTAEPDFRNVATELPRVLVAVCACGRPPATPFDPQELIRTIEKDPHVVSAVVLDQGCTANGWEALAETAEDAKANRILIGACNPYLYIGRLRELGRRIHLDPALMDVVDLRPPAVAQPAAIPAGEDGKAAGMQTDPTGLAHASTALQMTLSRLKGVEPAAMATISVTHRALVVGGGIAGMHAALCIADHGYPVDLVECGERLGGNLAWLKETIEGDPVGPLLEETVRKVEKYPHIATWLNSKIAGAFGEVGSFYTTIEDGDGSVQTIQHGTVVLATGGGEAPTDTYGFGTSESIITQQELETRLAGDDFDPQGLGTVVMIQCVGSREEPRNFCSRVCCPTSLKHALKIKSRNPDAAVYILYRDMMTPGFAESHFTAARKAGVIFIQYAVDEKPQVSAGPEPGNGLQVTARDPILGKRVAIDADLVVLATGVRPQLPPELAAMFGAHLDGDGFFAEADEKWRPVDALKEGVFGCGLALSPRSIPDAVASAGAAAQRCLRILAHDRLPTGKIVATVRHSLCCLCERCVEACPYAARSVDPDQGKVQVNPAMCQGCGECATVCPNSAAIVAGFTDRQMLDVIDSALT